MVRKSIKTLAIAIIFGIAGLTGCSDNEDSGYGEEQTEEDGSDKEDEENEGDDGEDTKPVSISLEEFRAVYNNVEEYMIYDGYVYRVEEFEDTNMEQLYSSMNHEGAKDPETNTLWVYGFPSEIAHEENAIIHLHFDKRNMDTWRLNGTGNNYTYIDFGYNPHYDRYIMGTNIWAYEMYWGSGSRVLILKYGEVVGKAAFFTNYGDWLLGNDYFNRGAEK